ncbi:MAG: tetratricopeptide repeat protein [Bryobacteraceae bacterium]|jgi:tetratricopeptide (TPR) repeat protein
MRAPRFAILTALAIGTLPAWPQTPPPVNPAQRDLKLEKIEDPTLPPTSVSIPRSYAVVVGISHYNNLPAKLQLQFPERDAQSLYTILISPEGGNFKAENVHVLTGAKATLAGLRREIDTWLPSVASPGDRVLIYFAGHGFLYQGQAYLAPVDFDSGRIAETGYPMRELGEVIGSRIHAKWKILFTDACHSGAISPEDSQSLNSVLSGVGNSIFSLTASRDVEPSFESPDLEGGHGVFTYYLVKGLEGAADTSHDGIVTADELAEYVHTQVREYTGQRQNPTSERGSFDPSMLLSYVPSLASPAIPPRPQYGALAIESNLDDVEVFIDGVSVGVVSKSKPLNVPGLSPGEHTVKGVKMGYEPDGPRQETVYPGQQTTVSIKILIARRRSKATLDLLDKGLEDYHKGYEQNYRRAAGLFEQAFQSDPTYSEAAFYLGLTYNALFEEEKAETWYKKAIEIDPDYLEARANYAGMLLDIGAVDEAIRQLNVVLVRQPGHVEALTMLAQAQRFKQIFGQSIETARRAIALAPRSAEPHLWLADSLRLSGKPADSIAEYGQYLKLSDFDSKFAGQVNYYVLGSLIGMGRRKRAAEQDIWKDLRSLAYFGICDANRTLSNFDLAIGFCQKSLSYDPQDPYAHYALGLAYLHKAVANNSAAELSPALRHFQQVVSLNPDLEEAGIARKNIANIEKVLAQKN